MSNVFISHHGRDDGKVQRLKKRLRDINKNTKNYSIDSAKHLGKKPNWSDAMINGVLKSRIKQSGTFICLIGKETYTRPWVNREVELAAQFGKTIIGIYAHGEAKSANIPEALKIFGNDVIGWNSLDKLDDIMRGVVIPAENCAGIQRSPIYPTIRIPCTK